MKKNNKKETLMEKLFNVYQEYEASIICGVLAMNGSTNVLPLYRLLTK